MKTTLDLGTGLQLARDAGTPLIAINTFDPEATMALVQKIVSQVDEDETEPALVQWDIVNGWKHRNSGGQDAIKKALDLSKMSIEEMMNPVAHLEASVWLPENTIVFVMNAQLHLKADKMKPEYVQAVWNLRDGFKHNARTLILLGTHIQLPVELQHDVLTLDEKLPDDQALTKIITDVFVNNGLPVPKNIAAGVDALRGLAAFPAEQAVAMSMSKRGLNVDGLWERKRQLIDQTPGLSVWMGGQKFDDLGGLDEIKSRFRRILAGRKPPKVTVWIDEIEKAMSGSDSGGGDTSGTSQDQLMNLLSEMQDKEYDGAILVGVPGAAKSAFAKSVANEADVLTIKLDLGAMKGQFVGMSEERIRQAMKIIEAVGGHAGAFFIATSNDIRCIRPELKRRFKKGIYFFDLPTVEERLVIWDMYIKKYKLEGDNSFEFGKDDNDWTGAEIENCAMMAYEERISLKEAAKSVIPVAVSGAADIRRLREEAQGKYSSTTRPGSYSLDQRAAEPIEPASKRKVNVRQ